MFPKSAPLVALAALALLSGCGRKPASGSDRNAAARTDASYAAAPSVREVRADAGGVLLTGSAPAGARIRLATPGGAAAFARADAAGRWSVRLAPAGEVRVFGLSETLPGRQVQAQGYVLVSPQGRAALLRAGAGALRLDPLRAPAIEAVDFDREGGAVISGVAAPDAWLFLRLDGRQTADGRADADGRYAIALSSIAHGAHTLQVVGDGFSSTGQVEVSSPAPLAAGPIRSQFTQGGLRVDWLTPGGGVQSTILLD